MKALFTSLMMLYLALDFADPHLPGAMTFDPENTVEVVKLSRTASLELPAVTASPGPGPRVRPAAVRQSLPRARRAVRRSRALARHVARRLPPDRSDSEAA